MSKLLNLNFDFSLAHLTDPTSFLGAVTIGVAIFLLAWFFSWLLGLVVRQWEKAIRKVFPKMDETIWRLVVRFKSLLVFLIALFIFASIVPSLRAFLGSLLAGAGIMAIVIGFAAKSTLANLVSGVAIAIYRPISIGDIVTIEDQYGIIEDITLRHTVLLTWDKKRLLIPNEKLDQMTVLNYSLTDKRIRQPIEMGVSYDTDIDLARHLILEVAKSCPHKISSTFAPDQPLVRVVDWANSSIILRLYLWCPSMDEAWLARFWILEHVKKRFDQEGVEIPFPYRTVVYKKDLPEALSAPPELAEAGRTPPPPSEPEPGPSELTVRKPANPSGKWANLWSGLRRKKQPDSEK